MRCEEYVPLFNELLNKTLSPVEERGVEAHLAACESCRAEFQRLKKADDLLREVICDMVSEIEVPSYLSNRIEEVLKKEQKQPARVTYSGWLPAFLKVPAAAAALLLFIAVSAFGYNYIFRAPLKQSEVVLQEPAVDNESKPFVSYDRAGSPAEPGQSPEEYGVADVQEKSAPVKPPQDTMLALKPEGTQNLMAESDAERLARENAPPGKGGEPGPEATTEQRGGAGAAKDTGQAPAPAQPAEPQPQEDRSLFAAGAPFTTAENEGGPDSVNGGFAQGTLEDAEKEVGFVCLEPDYLPQGTELQEVTWFSGTVNQNYRIGQLSLQISQSLAGASRAGIESASKDSSVLEINGVKGILKETEPGAENGTSKGYTTITWQQGDLLISVGGELPREELVKIASSLK